MWWFVGGYLLIAAAFYTYITATAKEDPEEAESAHRGAPATLAGLRRASVSHPEKSKRKTPRAA